MTNLTEELETLKSDPRGTIDGALNKLTWDEQQAWVEALHNGSPSQVMLARLLNKYSGVEVNHKQVSDWKRRHPLT